MATTLVISGVVTEDGLPVAKPVRFYRFDTFELAAETTSSGIDGSYSASLSVNDQYYVIVPRYGEYESLIHGPVTPVTTVEIDTSSPVLDLTVNSPMVLYLVQPTWVFQNTTSHTSFGAALDCNATHVFAQEPNVGTGTILIHTLSTGAYVDALPNPAATSDEYGADVSASSDYCLVGAPAADIGDTDSGAAYLFQLSDNTLVRRIDNPDAAPASDRFGHSVSVNNTYSLVGSPWEEDAYADSGKAYLFNNATGALVWTFDNPQTGNFDYSHFGTSVYVDDNYSIIGSPQDDTLGTDTGVAFVFDNSNGTLKWTLNQDAVNSQEFMGETIACNGVQIFVGSRGYYTKDENLLYVFSYATGAFMYRIDYVDIDPQWSWGLSDNNSLFGKAISADATNLFVSAPYEDWPGNQENNNGVVFQFEAATGTLIRMIWPPNGETESQNGLFGEGLYSNGTDLIVNLRRYGVNDYGAVMRFLVNA